MDRRLLSSSREPYKWLKKLSWPRHPCAAPGPVHAPELGALWDEADVVLAVGTDFDGTNTQNWKMPAPPVLISVNVDAAEAGKNYPADVALIGDARAVLEQLVPRVAARPGLPELERRLADIGDAVSDWVRDDEPAAAQLLEVIHRALPDDAVVVTDMCIPGYWLGGYWQVPRPRKLGYPLGWGTLGFGFPASLGAALAGAGPTVCVCGDGGFMYACGELATASRSGSRSRSCSSTTAATACCAMTSSSRARRRSASIW